MKMRFFAFPQMRRNTLALGLCLLAVLFALEAKTAWYGPAKGPGSDIQSQRALPADVPALVSHGVFVHPPAATAFAPIIFSSAAAIGWTRVHLLTGIDILLEPIPVYAASYFSPVLFFRPPPAL